MRNATKRRNHVEKTHGRIAVGPIQPSIVPELGNVQQLNHLESLQSLNWQTPLLQTVSNDRYIQPTLYNHHQNWTHEGVFTPPVNVRETDGAFIVEAYLPGVHKKDIHVEIKNGCILVIKGERQVQEEHLWENQEYLRREVNFKTFYRSFSLPVEVLPEGITAKFEHGMVLIRLNKKAEVKASTYTVPLRG